jgi:NADH-quinone oxidoreductase subunit N
MLFLSVEMASVPSYAMVAFLKGRRDSSEAALKYVVYGAGAAGVMLYGTSLVAGILGTVQFPEMTTQVGALLTGAKPGLSDAAVRTLALGALMVLVGLFFKLSIFPFHFWCPDAFQGASAEVAGFLSVASKAGAFALLVRFCLALVGDTSGALAELGLPLGIGLGVLAAVTATFGNLAAYSQRNAKRLLAYSTIAHAGYMLMAVSAMVVILSAPAEVRGEFGERGIDGAAIDAVHGLLYYLFVYLFMNLGAFAIVALIRNDIYSEEIEDYAGLGAQAALPCVCMAICLFSLVGFPPFGGFVGKFFVFAPVLDAAKVHWSMWFVLVIGGLNTVFSLFYYVRIPKAMFLEARPDGARPIESVISPSPKYYILLITIPVIFLGMMIRGLSETAQSAASVLF